MVTVELIRSVKKVEKVRFEQTFECLNVVGCSDELADHPEPMVTKLGVGDDVGEPYPCAKFHYDPIRGFCSPPPFPQKVTRLYSCFLTGTLPIMFK